MNAFVFPLSVDTVKLPGGDERSIINSELTLRDLFAVAIAQGMAAHYGRTLKSGGVDPVKLWATVDLILAAR
jgi:hypothetical protein